MRVWKTAWVASGTLVLVACAPTIGTYPAYDAGAAPPVAPPATGYDAGAPTAPVMGSGYDSGPTASPSSASDPCGDGLDGDADGTIDEACTCVLGATQACHTRADVAGVGACSTGQQRCEGSSEFGAWTACEGAVMPAEEICGNGIDENCNGAADEGCPTLVMVNVNLDGDCVSARCPPEAPYPYGCNIVMDGGDSRGCVASSPTSSEVYFQEGDRCGAGHVGGTLTCATEPGVGLNASNCLINKSQPMYPPNRDGCPDTGGFLGLGF